MELVEDIFSIILVMQIQIVYVVCEANNLADYLANIECDTESTHTYTLFKHLPNMAKTILNMDKHGIPSL